MRLRYTVLKALVDIGILALGLLIIYANQVIEADWVGWLGADGLGILIIVFGTYLGTIAFIELLLVYMRQDTWFAKGVKSLVSTLLLITIFPAVLFSLLWIFGYRIEGDIAISVMIIAIVRTLVRIWLGRVFERRSV